MSLVDRKKVSCVILNKVETADGYGGNAVEWSPGASFEASIYMSQSVQTKVADSQGVKGLYQVLVSRDIHLPYHSVFKRIEDKSKGITEQIYRVTSKDDNKTPDGAGINLRCVSAEEWSIPNG